MPIMSASGDGHQRNKIRKNLYYNTATGSARNGCFKFKDAVQQDNEYAYDANGNLTKDLNKGIAGISYNCLNLPGAVTFIDGNRITYTYAADGTKLRTVHGIGGAGTTTDYCTNVIYENGTAKFLLTEEGYVSLNLLVQRNMWTNTISIWTVDFFAISLHGLEDQERLMTEETSLYMVMDMRLCL